MPPLNVSRSRYPAISLQSAEVDVTKRDSKSVAYENRTKSLRCGGLETNGLRERISPFNTLSAVRRFSREARGYWQFQRTKTRRRMLVAEGLAEGEVLSSNGLLSWSVQKPTGESAPNPNRTSETLFHSNWALRHAPLRAACWQVARPRLALLPSASRGHFRRNFGCGFHVSSMEGKCLRRGCPPGALQHMSGVLAGLRHPGGEPGTRLRLQRGT